MDKPPLRKKGAKKVTSFKDEVEGKAGGKRKSTIAVLFNHIGDSLAGKESAQAGTTQTAEDPNMDKPPLRKKGAKKIASFKDEVEGKAGGKRKSTIAVLFNHIGDSLAGK